MGTADYRHAQAARGCRVVCVACVVFARYGHPLRFYITPHFRKCRAVVPLKLHLVPHTAARPNGFPKQALCKVAYAGVGRTAVGAPRSRVHALRSAVCAPLWLAWRCGISQALRAVCLVSGLRPWLFSFC